MGILDTPLSKKGILKALGQDPEKSNVLTVSTNPDGGLVFEDATTAGLRRAVGDK